jgi:hypothetical protein
VLIKGCASYQRTGVSVHTYKDGFDFDDDNDDSCSDTGTGVSGSQVGSPNIRRQASSSSSRSNNAGTGKQHNHNHNHNNHTLKKSTEVAHNSSSSGSVIDDNTAPGSRVNSTSYGCKNAASAAAAHAMLDNLQIVDFDEDMDLVAPGRKRTMTNESNFATSVVVSKPLYYTLPLLLRRSFLNMSRQPALCLNRISQGAFFGLILACFYAPMGSDQNSIQDRVGCLYELTALAFIGMLSCIAIFPNERNVFYREYVDGDYSTLAFFMSYFMIAIPFLVLTAAIISALMVFAVGLQPEPIALLIFTCVVFCFIFAGECVGVIFCSMFMHVGFSVNVMSVVISVFGKGISCVSVFFWGGGLYFTYCILFLFLSY